jgi:signal transduction histidine kinase
MLPAADPATGHRGYPEEMVTGVAALPAVRWRPVRQRPSPWVVDCALGVAVAVVQIWGTVLVVPSTQLGRLAEPLGLGWLLMGVSGLLLAGRRRRPVAVFGCVAALSVASSGAGYPEAPRWIALFLAMYSLTAYGDGRRSLRIAAAGKLVLIPVWLLTSDLTPLGGDGWIFFRIGTTVTFASLGESARARRVAAEEAARLAAYAERSREEEARRRVNAERLRIAREVHDTVAHAIAVINIQAGVTAHILDRRPEQVPEALLTIETLSARALQELRATLGMLCDVDADPRAPAPGLDRVGDLTATAAGAGLEVTLDMPHPPPQLPSAVDHAAFRILQESITNVIRHAGPARVTVRISSVDDPVEIHVEDDGRGEHDGGHPVGASRGIAGMRERAALLGGSLSAGPRPDGGFEVRARLPFPPAVPEAVLP